MPEVLAFTLPDDRFVEIADLKAELPDPSQLLGPVTSGNGWTAYVAVEGSVRGLTVASEPEAGARRVELRREAGASLADWALVERLTRALVPLAKSCALNGEPIDEAGLGRFFSAENLRGKRAGEWKMIYDRFFRMGRGRAVLASPLFEITVHLEDVTFAGEVIDHLDELEERLSSRVTACMYADVVDIEQSDGPARFKFARWRIDRPALVPEVDRVLVVKGAPVGFVTLAELARMLGPRAEVARQRPPRRILLPALDARHNDAALVALIEKTARAKPPLL